jgi:hypothetical protein
MFTSKNILLMLFTFVFVLSTVAQEKTIKKNQVPSAVLDSFAKAYPNSTVKRYAKEIENGKTYYEIESREGKISRDLLFEPDGKIAEIEESVPYDSLPTAIKDTISSKYGKSAFLSAEKITHPGKPLTYGLVLKVNGKKREMDFNPDGTRVKGGEEAMEKGERDTSQTEQGENETD